MNPVASVCRKCRSDFIVEPDDISYYDKIGVNHPDLCPPCRAQLRLSFRNERVFYKRACDKCHKDVISMYSPNKPFIVWCYECWFADDWDSAEYGIEYDQSRPFLEQFEEVWKKVPKIALIYVRSPGSEYINISADSKNCYMIVESSNNEDSIHSYWIQECKDVIDTSFSSKCELTYESDDCFNSYKLFYSKGCHDSNNGYFLTDCRGCTDCIGCVNLRQRSNYIFNQPYSKEEYEDIKKNLALDTYAGVEAFREKYKEFLMREPRKFAETIQTINSTGNYMKNTKNCLSCFHCYEAEDNKYGEHVWRNAKDCMDVSTAGRNANSIYNSINTGIDVANHICVAQGWSSTFLEYSHNSFNSNYCFGCVGVRKKEYCILNKQYSKEEYESLTGSIRAQLKEKGEYGQFFPPQFSCFGYNETAAQEQFPLSKDEALAQGFMWEDTPRGTYGKETKALAEIPDSINDVDFEVPKEIFACVSCTKNYRIIPNEFTFYQKLSIPLPRLCPDCRHMRRIEARGPNKLWQRKCICAKENHDHAGECPNQFQTSYSPERTEIIYCEACYQREVV
ncbi:MAG: hypothetical protein V4665_04150 [Patescibacteria group bacterium]